MKLWSLLCCMALARAVTGISSDAVPPHVGAEFADFDDVISEDTSRFTALLSSSQPERRVEGLQGLSHLKHWASESAALRLLDDPAREVRRQALLTVCRIGTARSVPKLLALLDAQDWELRQNAFLALSRMTGREFALEEKEEWQLWWSGTPLTEKINELLATASAGIGEAGPPSVDASPLATRDGRVDPSARRVARGRPGRIRSSSYSPASSPARRAALRALVHLADGSAEDPLIRLLTRPQTPPLEPDERSFICEALERIGTGRAVSALAKESVPAAAWALGRIGGSEAEQALLDAPKALPVLLALDRLRSTNVGAFIPQLVGQMGLVTYRGQPDDVMNQELQPIQRVGANLIRRSGRANELVEQILLELEYTSTNKPASPRPPIPADWKRMIEAMRSELKAGFVREDGTTTSQPLVALSLIVSDRALAPRLLPLLGHPAFVARVYVAFALARLPAPEAVPVLVDMIRQGYPFSDSTALASGKHFEHSQTVRWRGFLCMALGRLATDSARLALEEFASDEKAPRDIRYSSVVGLRFVSSATSLPVLQRVAEHDLIWTVREEASRAIENISVLQAENLQRMEARR